ncbi:putative LAGLIDADG endonuclease (mitochondrion) [Astrephomene gubernaculifera]|nr:putative LAGLIDADG endonuclease [Astrephomene gubernaculifera]
MLKCIQSVIGGKVRIDSAKEFVSWVTDSRTHILSILAIFEQYPLLTTRKKCQLSFMKQCLHTNDVAWYLQYRDYKYHHVYIPTTTEDFKQLSRAEPFFAKGHSPSAKFFPYFGAWLSGFIEAEGCFTLRENSSRVLSFSISQNTDNHLLCYIAFYLGIPTLPHLVKSNNNVPFYTLETSNISALINICNHLNTFPLMGAKKDSFNIFVHKLCNKDKPLRN